MPDPLTPVDAIHLDPHSPQTPSEAARQTSPTAPAVAARSDEPTVTTSSEEDELREVEHRMAVARNRLFRRLAEVSRRVDHAKEKLDVREMIRKHEWIAVGASVAVGALLALPGSGKKARVATPGKTVPARMGSMLAAVGVALAKDAIMAYAKRTFTEPPPSDAFAASMPSPSSERITAPALSPTAPY